MKTTLIGGYAKHCSEKGRLLKYATLTAIADNMELPYYVALGITKDEMFYPALRVVGNHEKLEEFIKKVLEGNESWLQIIVEES